MLLLVGEEVGDHIHSVQLSRCFIVCQPPQLDRMCPAIDVHVASSHGSLLPISLTSSGSHPKLLPNIVAGRHIQVPVICRKHKLPGKLLTFSPCASISVTSQLQINWLHFRLIFGLWRGLCFKCGVQEQRDLRVTLQVNDCGKRFHVLVECLKLPLDVQLFSATQAVNINLKGGMRSNTHKSLTINFDLLARM